MDVIALAEHGITNAVATLGTATTPDHLRQLLRTAPEVVFCFDGDRAGREAAWRAAENALPMLGGNQQLKFMFLPDGEDPDSMVRRHGAEAFESEVLHAQNYSDFFFAWLTEKVELGSMDGRARFVEIVKPYLKHVPAGVYRDMLEQRLAELSQTNMATLNRHIEKPAQKQQRPAKKQTMATMTPLRLAISILLQYPILAREIDDTSSLSSLDLPGVNILKELLETLHEHPHLTTAALLERWRNRENGAHLQKLALQSLSLSADELKYELLGIFSQLQKQAKQQRRIYLESKPLSELTEAEKAELRLSQS
jgi:DNA primase